MPTSATFRGITNIGQPTLTERIYDNIYMFLDWNFVNIGAYFNVTMPTSGAYSQNASDDFSILRPVVDKNFTNGQVWESARLNWVWESGLSQSVQPISISGVYINGSFNPSSGVGPNSHYYDYPNGRVIFNTPISTASTVRLEYSYKWINVVRAKDVPWLRSVQHNSFRIDSPQYDLVGSGDLHAPGYTRLQLPFIAVELGGRVSSPYELGSSKEYKETNILFHIFAEDDWICGKLADILDSQNNKTIFMFEPDVLYQSGTWPLNYRGEIATGAKTYPDIVEITGNNGYSRGHNLRFGATEIQPGQWLTRNLYTSRVRTTAEVISGQA